MLVNYLNMLIAAGNNRFKKTDFCLFAKTEQAYGSVLVTVISESPECDLLQDREVLKLLLHF